MNGIKTHPQPENKQILLRAHRDQIIGLLGIAQPFPIRNLEIQYDRMVAFQGTLEVVIRNSQQGVEYQLYDAQRLEERGKIKYD